MADVILAPYLPLRGTTADVGPWHLVPLAQIKHVECTFPEIATESTVIHAQVSEAVTV